MMTRIGRGVTIVALLVGMVGVSLWAEQGADVERIRQRLSGSYKLMSYISYDQNGVATTLPYSAGQISYDAAGRMSAQLMRADRPTVTPGRPLSEAERAALYSGYIAYFGRYTIDPARPVVTHHVEGSVTPNMLGQAMPRWYELSADGSTLILQTKTGDRVTGRLHWERYK